MKIFSLIGCLFDRLCVVFGAFIGSQIPEFLQQYAQRLAGHVEELNHLLQNLRQLAAYSNKTMEQYLQKFLSSSDSDFARQGEFLHGMVIRREELNQTLKHLLQSSIWERPYVFFKELQYDIARSTLASFQPGVNLSLEGMCYIGIGLLLGLIFYRMISKCVTIGCHLVHGVSTSKTK